MEKTTVQINRKPKLVLCDLPNTLFDARHRAIPEINEVHISNIHKDVFNYAAFSLIKDLQKLGYHIIYTHYCLNRLRPKVEELLKRHKLDIDSLYTNFPVQQVCSNNSLKRFLYEQHFEFDYVIDNDQNMRAYWDNQGVGLINVPLPVKYSEELR